MRHALLISFCGSIMQNAPSDIIKAIYDTCFDAVIRIVLQSDDHSEMQVYFFLRHVFNFHTCIVYG
jgi:hypothetical protein